MAGTMLANEQSGVYSALRDADEQIALSALKMPSRPRTIDLTSAISKLPLPAALTELRTLDQRSETFKRYYKEAAEQLPIRLAEKLGHLFEEKIGPENVLLTLGVRDAIAQLLVCSDKFRRGAITMPPCFPGYHSVLEQQGVPNLKIGLTCWGVKHRFNLPALERALSSESRDSKSRSGKVSPEVVIATTPNTPTCSFPDVGDLRELDTLCREKSKLLIMDNTFDTFDLTDPWRPVPLSLHSTTIVSSIGESYSLKQLGIKIGYLVASVPTVRALRERASRQVDSEQTSRMATACAYKAMFGSEGFIERRNLTLRMRHEFSACLKSAGHVSGLSGEAGTTKWIKFDSPFSASAAVRKLSQEGIKVTPGADYGISDAIRISLLAEPSEPAFRDAITRIWQVLST